MFFHINFFMLVSKPLAIPYIKDLDANFNPRPYGSGSVDLSSYISLTLFILTPRLNLS